VWKDPDSFRPERFLDEEGAVRGKHDIMPFSLGKLQANCPLLLLLSCHGISVF
jgi:Cytochrome P450